jgi:hypothetical protein
LDKKWRDLIVVLVSHLDRVFAQIVEDILYTFALDDLLLVDILARLRINFAVYEFPNDICAQGFAELLKDQGSNRIYNRST